MQRGCLQQLQQPPDLENSVIFVLIFALLICNTAGSLASGLARSLALAAAAALNGLRDILGLDCLDSGHGMILLLDKLLYLLYDSTTKTYSCQ